MLPERLVVERSEIIQGELANLHGLCVMGHLGIRLGIIEEDLRRRVCLHTYRSGHATGDADEVPEAMCALVANANDTMATTNDARETVLIEIFADYGIELVFSGSYA